MEKAKGMETNQSSTAATTRMEGGPICSKGKNSEGGSRPKASRREKENVTERAAIVGRRVTEAETARVEGARAESNAHP